MCVPEHNDDDGCFSGQYVEARLDHLAMLGVFSGANPFQTIPIWEALYHCRSEEGKGTVRACVRGDAVVCAPTSNWWPLVWIETDADKHQGQWVPTANQTVYWRSCGARTRFRRTKSSHLDGKGRQKGFGVCRKRSLAGTTYLQSNLNGGGRSKNWHTHIARTR